MSTITGNPFRTLVLLEGVARRLVFLKGLPRFGLPLPREFLLGDLDREPCPFPLDSPFSQDRVSFHTSLPESTDFSSSTVRNLNCFFLLFPYTCPWRQQRHRRTFQDVFTRRNKCF